MFSAFIRATRGALSTSAPALQILSSRSQQRLALTLSHVTPPVRVRSSLPQLNPLFTSGDELRSPYSKEATLPPTRVHSARSHILIIYTGGTFGMTRRDDGSYAPTALKDQLLRIESINRPEMPTYEVAEWEHPIDSSDMTPEGWARIAKQVEENYYQYDGFVVLHGTDTMAYTASALTFMFENLGKPVILTGAAIPLTEVYNDASRNLVVSMIIAGNLDVPEVCVWFSNQLLRGNRCRKIDSWGTECFSSPNFSPLATLGSRLAVNHALCLPHPKRRFKVHTNMCPNIVVLSLTPGFDDTVLMAVAEHGNLEGIVLQTYGTGNAPSAKRSFIQSVEKLIKSGVAVVIQTQCVRGFVQLSQYATGKQLEELGVITSHDMTPEATVTKLSFLLGSGLKGDALKLAMETDLRGELSKNKDQSLFKLTTSIL